MVTVEVIVKVRNIVLVLTKVQGAGQADGHGHGPEVSESAHICSLFLC